MVVRAVRGGMTAVLTGVLVCALSGCFLHKRVQTQQPVILARQTTVPLETPPVVASPPLLDAPNQAKLPTVPVAEAATKPKRVRRRPKQTAAAAAQTSAGAASAGGANVPGQTSAAGTVQVAGNAAPPPAPGAMTAGSAAGAETVIGALTPGGADQTPQARQDAQALLASTDRRLNALPPQAQQTQKAQISQIRNFWRQGVDAYKAGDAEGARTLALKAKLLLDDLEKAGQ